MASDDETAESGRAIEQISGTLYTVDGSGTDTLHLMLDCPHVDERLVHGDYDVSADGPRPIKAEEVSDRFLAEASLCGTCRRLFPEEVKARVA